MSAFRAHAAGRAAGRLALLAALGAACAGCGGGRGGVAPRGEPVVYPPAPQPPRVIALGTLRGAPPPSGTQVELSLFLFGVEPPAPLTIANPTGLAALPDGLLICDSALRLVFRWDAAADRVSAEHFQPPLTRPLAIAAASDGGRLVCDDGRVVRTDAAGRALVEYVPAPGEFRPAGVLQVGDEVWVSNLAAHRIEVFDAASGAHLRCIGRRGDGPGEFALPRGLARTPAGAVCVVDMLNNRVQVLAADGSWIRDIGAPGDTPGCFGRPRDVAVGPDGTVFVSDAFSQRVHAFAADGQPLLAFGEPDSGSGALALPAGIAVGHEAPRLERGLPPGLTPAYYVFVSEQLLRPGVRVYAWLGATDGAAGEPPPSGVARQWRPHFPQSAAINPHWRADRCTKCHEQGNGRMLSIAPEAVDRLCLSCHDGQQAFADPHPIGRPAVTELVTTPAGWPTVNGTLACITCHDIRRHCDVAARRPAVNDILLRGYDPQRPLDYCMNCHHADALGRFSPHRQRDAAGRVREDACFFCHTQRPEIPADGRRRFQPHLRDESSDLCLNCHRKHWDLSPLGHVDRPITPAVRQWMVTRELGLTSDLPLEELARRAAESERPPARLPLGGQESRTPGGGERVTCYTCHNPHYAGLFPPDSELGALADDARDRASALRANWIDLCSECHRR